jgi:hypothetical protein
MMMYLVARGNAAALAETAAEFRLDPAAIPKNYAK